MAVDPLFLSAGLTGTDGLYSSQTDGHAHGSAGKTYVPPSLHLYDSGGYLSGPSTGAPLNVALDYLSDNATTIGLTAADLQNYSITSQYVSQHTGVTHIYLQQTHGGLKVLGGNININVSAAGEVINVGSSFVGGLEGPLSAFHLEPAIAAPDALESLADDFGWTMDVTPSVLSFEDDPSARTILTASGVSRADIPAELVFVPTPDGGVELGWKLFVETMDGNHAYEASVSALDGDMLYYSDLVDADSYRVYKEPIADPSDGGRTLVVNPADTVASPFGWHDTNGVSGAEFTVTRGNNTRAYADRDDNNSPDSGSEPNGTSALVFDFNVNLAQAPLTYRDAAVTNLFYWNNFLHDVFYQYGFDEPSGNFQINNYGHGGLGNDSVLAEAQDGAELSPPNANNANMFTPVDGQSPRMQMYEFNLTSPNRDGDFANEIIAHEYGHGVSNRLTGGPGNVNALDAIQSGGMGEGWGDWWSLMLTQKVTDTKLGAYPVGTYVLGQAQNGSGIRRVPYSFDMSIDPLTYRDFNGSNEVHDSGEIWCSALWDLNWLLVDQYGFDPDFYGGTGGNNLALQLVMDGLKIQPANPSFLDGRDAILTADQILTGGANNAIIWQAFARRGMGFSAFDGGSGNATTVVEAFDVPATSAGNVEFDGETYEPGETVTITLRDIDLAGGGPISVVVTSSALDVENVTLTESQSAAGIFTGTIATAAAIALPTSGVLEVSQGDTLTVTYNDANNGNGVPVTVTDTAEIIQLSTIYSANMNTNPGWTHTGQWAYGTPTGGGGDPSSGHTGSNVVGYNLNGAYPNNISTTFYTTTQVIDCSGYENVTLSFWRWLGIESSSYDQANIQVSNDGVNWNTIWNHTGGSFQESSWSLQEYDISAFADGRSNVRIRWGLGPTDSSVVYSGWNIDDVLMRGVTTGTLDFGDAPDQYQTSLGNNGAQHPSIGPLMGTYRDTEPDGQPGNSAAGDDTNGAQDDEDGIVFTSALIGGQLGTVDVTVSGAGFLNAWIDFNGDGDWVDAGEQIFDDVLLQAGVHSLSFSVVATPSSSSYARFRFSSQPGLSSAGLAVDGEVEDYGFGTISGSKWNDLDGNGVWNQQVEPALPGWVIFLDRDNDGQLDSGEVSTTTDSNGNYTFVGVATGNYFVGEVVQQGWVQTSPGGVNSTGLIQNGGFETGDFTGWTVVDSGSGQFVINNGSLDPVSPDGPLPPHSGSFSAITNMTGGGMHTIYQDVVIPGGSHLTLEWWDRVRNHNSIFQDPNQEYRVEIRNSSNQVLSTVFSTNPGDVPLQDWTSRSADLTPFAGQTIRIAFVEQDNLFYFNLHVDDVRITGGGGASTIPVTVIAGQVVANVNFGNRFGLAGEIRGTKWNDLNRNGVWDQQSEPGLPGWTIFLDYNNNGVLDSGEDSTVTGSDGSYVFDPVSPGSYYVGEVLQPGWVQTSPGGSSTTGLIVNGGFETGDFSGWTFQNSGTGSFVINNGTFDPASPDGPLPPFSGVYSALSNMNNPGTQIIYQDVVIPAGSNMTLEWQDQIRNHAPNFQDPNQEYRVEIRNTSNQLLSTVFSTNSGDALFQSWTPRSANLSAFAGQTVRIAYVVQENLFFLNIHLDDIRLTGGSSGGGASTIPVLVGIGQVVNNVNFGNHLTTPGGIFGTKWNDLDGDGVKEDGEPGLPGWTIYLDQNGDDQIVTAGHVEPDDFDIGSTINNAVPGVTLTTIGSLGSEVFAGVPSGGFASTGSVTFTGNSPFGWGSNNRLRVDFSSSQSVVSIDAISDDSLDVGTLEAYDSHNSLIETYITGNLGAGAIETMTISRPTPDIAYVVARGAAADVLNLDNLQFSRTDLSTITDADGNYQFTPLPAALYFVKEEQQPGWVQTFAPVPVISGPDIDVIGVNFGNHALPGALFGQKWNDLDGDGVKDPGEPGLQGWTIFLDENHNGVLDQAIADLDPDDFPVGALLNSVVPGVTVSTIGGTTGDVFGGVPSGGIASTGTLAFVSLGSSTWTPTRRLRADFSVPTHVVSIDMIGNDSAETGSLEAYDSNGVLLDVFNSATVGDGGVATMTVTSLTTNIAYVIAYGTNGNTIDLDNLTFDGGGERSATTDLDGNYSFVSLAPGDYDVAEVQQPGWVQTFPQGGGSQLITIGAAQTVTDVNFGNQYLAPPLVGDYNLNGIVDAPDYSMWRNSLGKVVPQYSGADGSGNGLIDKADYSMWKAHFGDVAAPLGGGGGQSGALVAEAWKQVAPQEYSASATGATPAEFGSQPEFSAVVGARNDSPAETVVVISIVDSGQPTQSSQRDARRARLAEANRPIANRRDEALLAWLASSFDDSLGSGNGEESEVASEQEAGVSSDSFLSALDEAFEELLIDAA